MNPKEPTELQNISFASIQPLQYNDGEMVIAGDRLVRLPTLSTGKFGTSVASSSKQQTQIPHYIAGPGTFIRNGNVHASIVGKVQVLTSTISIPSSKCDNNVVAVSDQQNESPQQTTLVTVSVVPNNGCYRGMQQIINKGEVVLGRISRVQPGVMQHQLIQQQQIFVDIIANQYGLLDVLAYGTIRRDDITKLKPDGGTSLTSSLTHYFRTGDFIVAKALSLGDANSSASSGGRYYLTTAESSLGVIYASCSSNIHGNPNDPSTNSSSNDMVPVLIPISYHEMECPICGIIERRKCARPPI